MKCLFINTINNVYNNCESFFNFYVKFRVMDLKPLLSVMHPRRLPFFLNSIARLDYVDVLLAKNYVEIEAQSRIRDFFLKSDYNMLMLMSDDAEVPYDVPSFLIEDFKSGNYDIISGWSNSRDPPSLMGRDANINREPPRSIEGRINQPFWYHDYNLIKIQEIQSLLAQGVNIIPVWFNGFSLTCMSRRVAEVWTPRGWYFMRASPFHETYRGARGFWGCTDLWFSYQMWKLGFKSFCDLRAFIPHHPPKDRRLMVGVEPSELTLIPKRRTINA